MKRLPLLALALCLGTAGSAQRPAAEPPAGNNVQVIDQRSSQAALARGEINFDDLQFPIEIDQRFTDDLLTDEVRQLDGREITIRGYILPTTLFKQTGIRQFVLVRDNQECCFGPGAALYDCMIVDMVPPETIDFTVRPITVKGKLTIDTKSYAHPGGKGPKGTSHFAIFHLDGKDVQ